VAAGWTARSIVPAGPEILAECGRCVRENIGRAAGRSGRFATTAGRLPAHWVIHTVGPVWAKRTDRGDVLRSCYVESKRVAADWARVNCVSGNFDRALPLADGRCARIAVAAVRSATSVVEDVRLWSSSGDAEKAFSVRQSALDRSVAAGSV